MVLNKIENRYRKYPNQIDNQGNTFLMHLVLTKKTNNFAYFLENNDFYQNIHYFNHLNNNGEDLFMMACKHSLENEALLILNKFNKLNYIPNFNLVDKNKNTSIMYILKNNLVNISKILFTDYLNYININYINNIENSSYLLFALTNKNLYVLNIILNKLMLNLDELLENIKVFGIYINNIKLYIKEEDTLMFNKVYQSLLNLHKKEKIKYLVEKYDNKYPMRIPTELFTNIYNFTLSI